MKGYIHSFESFGTVDGPGIRFVVFMQGCPLRCLYCHNPDTWGEGGKEYSADEVAKQILKYKNYFGDRGGVTISGGEPLLQIDFIIELFTVLKQSGIHTCIDTSGYPFDKNDLELVKKFDKLIQLTDLVLLDIKHIDSSKHEIITGKKNTRTLDFSKYLDQNHIDTWIRYVVLPGYSDSLEDAKELSNYIKELSCVKKVEVLPYHTMGEVKYKNLGLKYRLEGVKPPEGNTVNKIKEILKI